MYHISVQIQNVTTHLDGCERVSSKDRDDDSIQHIICGSPGMKGLDTNEQDAQLISYLSKRSYHVEIISGDLHIYRSHGLFEAIFYGGLPTKRSRMICVMGIPSYMPIVDFIGFLHGSCDNMIFLRVIRDKRTHHVIIMVEFKTQDAADQFFTEFNGKPFQTFCDEACNLVFVSDVTFAAHLEKESSTQFVELPTCLLCLDRLEPSHTGILMTTSDHVLDLSLSVPQFQPCEVCNRCLEGRVCPNVCFQCERSDDLWICIVCGFLGCGRYQAGHSMQHQEQTGHNYALELSSLRIWDYISDGYVHRLLPTKSDSHTKSDASDAPYKRYSRSCTHQMDQGKVEELTLEYNQLLLNQLDAQRSWFEEKMTEMKATHERVALSLKTELAELKQEHLKTSESIDRERKAHERKSQQIHEKYRKELDEIESMKQIYSTTVVTQKEWQDRCAHLELKIKETRIRKDAMIADLEEQVRDLSFTIDAQRKMGGNADVRDGQVSIVVQERPSPSRSRKGRKKGG